METTILKHLAERDTRLHTYALDAMRIASPKLSRIIEVFPHYTCHDITHSMAVCDICAWLAGPTVLAQLTPHELLVLFAAMCFHDVGMALDADERTSIESHDGFRQFQADSGLPLIEALAEWVRRVHHTRSADQVRACFTLPGGIGIPDKALVHAVALLCQSHGQQDLADFETYHPFYAIGRSGDTLCLPLLGVLLRLSDLLHVTDDRTPLAVLPHLKLESAKSKEEWRKHLSTVGVAPRPGGTIVMNCICSDAATHRALLRLCDYANREFAYCSQILDLLAAEGRPRYELATASLRPSIRAEGYIPWVDLQFDLDREGILRLLTGARLYQGPGSVLRELLMNAVDASRQRARVSGDLHPIRVRLSTAERTLVVEDSGSGMDEEDVRRFLLRLGRSLYHSEEYDRRYSAALRIESLSEFGIGFASCFLAADHVVLETKRSEADPLMLDMYDLLGFVAARPSMRTDAGSRVTLHLKDEAVKQIESAIRCLPAACPHVDVEIQTDIDGERAVVSSQPYWEDDQELLTPYFRTRESAFAVERWDPGAVTDDVRGRLSLMVHRRDGVVFPGGVEWYRMRQGGGLPRRLSQLGFALPGLSSDLNSVIGQMNIASFGYDLDLRGDMRLELDAARTRILPTEHNRAVIDQLDRHLVSFLLDLHKRYWEPLPRECRLDAWDAVSRALFTRAMALPIFPYHQPAWPLADLILANAPIEVWTRGEPPRRLSWDEVRAIDRPVVFYLRFRLLMGHDERVRQLCEALPHALVLVEDPGYQRFHSTLAHVCDETGIHVSDEQEQTFTILRPWKGATAEIARRMLDPTRVNPWGFVVPFVPPRPYALVSSHSTQMSDGLRTWLNAWHPKIRRLIEVAQLAQAQGKVLKESTAFLRFLYEDHRGPGSDPAYVRYIQSQQAPMLAELRSGGWISADEHSSLRLAMEDFVLWEWSTH